MFRVIHQGVEFFYLKRKLFFPQQNTILEKLPSSASGMHIFENFYFFSTNLYFLKIGYLLFRAQYFRFHFGAKCVRSFFHFCKLFIIEQIDESDRNDGLSISKLKRKNKKNMCAASKRAVTASYLLVSHQCHK